jgi:arylsulfatase A-like enzyme
MIQSASERFSLRPGDVVLSGLWFGLLAGLIEAIVMEVRRSGLGHRTAMGPHIVWMAPAMDVVWLLVPALLLALLVHFWKSPRANWLAIFGLAFPASVAVAFLAIVQLHTYALIVIAIGMAVQITAAVARYPRGFVRLVQRTTAVLLGLVVLGAGLVFGRERWAERQALGRMPQPEAGAPNVLLLILDTARALSMSVNGYERPTSPELERFARKGVVFLDAQAPSSWTLPSHAGMFTGRLPHQLSTGFRAGLDSTYPTLAEALRDAGYHTAGFVANLHYASRDFGLNRGFLRYEDYGISFGEMFLNSSVGRYLAIHPGFRRLVGYYDILGRKKAETINHHLLGWLNQRGNNRPFFAFVNYYDAHEPYLPPAEFDRKFASDIQRKPYLTDQSIRGARRLVKLQMTPAEIRREHEAYAASIAYLDHQIGMLLDSLEVRGILKNTLVIITSDHGEQFGEHGMFVHGNSLYQPLVNVPLIMSLPRAVPENRVVRGPLNLRDIATTVMDLTGTEGGDRFDGHSLRRFWDSTQDPVGEPLLLEVITTGKPSGKVEELRAVRLGSLEYIRHQDGREELYDLAADPGELHNLTKDSAAQVRLVSLRSTMDSIITATGDDQWPFDSE